MIKLHISNFYSCSEIGTSSELFYICELSKYLNKVDKSLSIDGVILLDNLKLSEVAWDYFRFCVSEGYIVDANLPSSELDFLKNPINYVNEGFKNFLFTRDECPYDSTDTTMRSNSAEYDYKTAKPTQVCYAVENQEVWMWNVDGKSSDDKLINLRNLNSSCASKAWLSMIAMVAVNRLLTGEPKNLCIEFSSPIAKNQLALSDFLVLSEDSNAIKGWVLYAFDPSVAESEQRQIGYEAWWHKGKEMGYLSRYYTPAEKLAHLKKLNIKVGDVVFYYERFYKTQYNYVKEIAGCRLAIVRGIHARSIDLEIVNNVKTRYGYEVRFQNLSEEVRSMYCGSDSYKKYNSRFTSVELCDLGIEYLMYSETQFLCPLGESDDIVQLDVTDYKGRTGKYALRQNDTVYWILKDYGVEFNEKKFLETYFKDRLTSYEVFMSGYDLPEEWKVQN